MIGVLWFVHTWPSTRTSRCQDLHVSSNNGHITDVKLFSDSLYPEMIESITEQLNGMTIVWVIDNNTEIGAQYHQDGIENALGLAMYHHNDPTIIKQISEYKDWLKKSL